MTAAFQRPLNRYNRDLLRPDQYKTYQIAAPRSSHYRPATCEEAGCLAYHNGWEVHLEALTPEQRDAVLATGRKYVIEDRGPNQTVLCFAPAQLCFRYDEHVVPTGRPALFVVRRGDYRQSTVLHTHATPEAWRDDLAEHQSRWADFVQQKG